MHPFTSFTLLYLPIILFSSTSLVSAVYTVHSSLLYLRTADRTPLNLPSLTPGTLTPLGAQQAFSVGQFFRQRYITGALSSSTNTTSGLNEAPISGLKADVLDHGQVWVQSVEEQWGVASAMAFLQGFYPGLGQGNGVSDEEGVLGNGSYVSLFANIIFSFQGFYCLRKRRPSRIEEGIHFEYPHVFDLFFLLHQKCRIKTSISSVHIDTSPPFRLPVSTTADSLVRLRLLNLHISAPKLSRVQRLRRNHIQHPGFFPDGNGHPVFLHGHW